MNLAWQRVPFLRHVQAQSPGWWRRDIAAGLVLTGLGNDGPFHYKRSRRGDTRTDAAATLLLRERGADLQRALLKLAMMHKEIAGFLLRVRDRKAHAVRGHDTGVADLAARFRVERRAVKHHREGCIARCFRHFQALEIDSRDPGLQLQAVIAMKFGGPSGIGNARSGAEP